MRYQERSWSCGAAAVVNAALCFGRRVPERLVRTVAETTPDGTDEGGIVRALCTLGLKGTIFNGVDFRFALACVADTPAIVCAYNLQHWVTLAGRTDGGRRYIVIDSSNVKRNVRENGVAVLDRRGLRKIWQTRNGEFFGILVTRRK